MKNTIIDTEWLKNYLNDKKLVILDASQTPITAKDSTEASSIRIPAARFIDVKNNFSDKNSTYPNTLLSPLEFQEAARKLGINQDSFIVVYDNIGVYSSPRVWWMFQTMGHKNIVVLDGGLKAWTEAGMKTEAIQSNNNIYGDFIADFKAENLRDFEFIRDNIISENCLVLDARSEGRFNGTAPEPRPELASGKIENSMNIPFEAVLNGHKFKTKTELEQIFQNARSKGKPMVFSCGSGLTACIILLAAEIIDDSPKSVYDGSWTEWIQRI